MTMTVWRVLRSLTGLESGRWCRCCGQPVPRRDELGLSEGVCGPCRSASDP